MILGLDLYPGYQPEVKSSTGENMGALGQVTCSFKINGTTFTQHMTRPFILGTDFTVTNFMSVIWMREGTHSNRSTIIELPDQTTGVPLVLSISIKIPPHGRV